MKVSLLEEKISSLRDNTTNIENINNDIDILVKCVNDKIINLEEIYKNLINKNKKNSFHICGLDAFNFQVKIIRLEYKNGLDYYMMILNRIYCDYYRFYNTLYNYVDMCVENINTEKKIFPVYDYLDMNKKYSFNLIRELEKENLFLLDVILKWLKQLILEFHTYKIKNKSGIEIKNILFTYEHNISSVYDKIVFYCKLIEFSHQIHIKYLKKLVLRLNDIKDDLDNEFNLDESKLIKSDTENEIEDLLSPISLEDSYSNVSQ